MKNINQDVHDFTGGERRRRDKLPEVREVCNEAERVRSASDFH